MYQTTIDGTDVVVYSLEEHAQAEVHKRLCHETQKVLNNISSSGDDQE